MGQTCVQLCASPQQRCQPYACMTSTLHPRGVHRSSSESEDSDAEALTADVEKDFFVTLAKIKDNR